MYCKTFPVLHSHMLWHWWVRRVLMMHGSKYKDSILHIPAQHTQIQWRQPLLVCCFLEDYNIYGLQDMHKQMAKSLSWLVFPFHLCIIVFKLWLWMPINTQTKDCTASLRSAWVAPVSPTTLLKSWTEIPQKSLLSWYVIFALQVWYHIRASEILHA